MRTTEGKPEGERIVLGDADLAEAMANALAVTGEVERATHGFHTWPAGLHPDAARDLIGLFPGTSVLDPFCGGGTVLVEAMLAGRLAVGRDLSPVAVRVARARTSLADEALLSRMRSLARKLTDGARHAQDLPPDEILDGLRDWYAKHVVWELEFIRRGILEAPADLQPLLDVLFSSILVKTSWRKSDTSAQRIKHDRPAGTAAILFHEKARELGRRIAALRDAVPTGTPPADIRQGDARHLEVPPVNLVLTSPPYPATYDYLPLQHLRRIWFGERHDDESEIGARRQWREGSRDAKKRWAEDTRAWTLSAARAVTPGWHVVIVIGDGSTPAGPIDSSAAPEEAAKAAGLRSIARASLERPDFSTGGSRWEHVFAFRKEQA